LSGAVPTSAPTDRSALLAKLTDGVAALTDSAQWQRYLAVQSRFHTYSPNNALLIAAQREDATRVAGFRAWQRLNRSVRKGERAIAILAPIVTRPKNDRDAVPMAIRAFKWVAVFDISQTVGDDLPNVSARLEGDDPTNHYATLVSLATSIGFRVDDVELAGSANGDCIHDLGRIRIEVRNAPLQRVKSLAHELAHALLHQRFESRSLAELEAESVAYIVCQALDVDSASYSFGYLAAWAGGRQAVEEIIASCGRIQRAAATILAPFEVATQI
jgi:N-terminal domain of anti-restriction factor ArdC